MNQAARILIVDDDPDFLDSTRSMLEGASYRVSVAPGEDEALIEIEAERPDLLILDVMMSQWNSGFRFMWKLKADARYRSIPTLIVTGVDKEVHMDFAQPANKLHRDSDEEAYLPVAGYIVKPVTISVLLDKVAQILSRMVAQRRGSASSIPRCPRSRRNDTSRKRQESSS